VVKTSSHCCNMESETSNCGKWRKSFLNRHDKLVHVSARCHPIHVLGWLVCLFTVYYIIRM
jgi:hypothetical protein